MGLKIRHATIKEIIAIVKFIDKPPMKHNAHNKRRSLAASGDQRERISLSGYVFLYTLDRWVIFTTFMTRVLSLIS